MEHVIAVYILVESGTLLGFIVLSLLTLDELRERGELKWP